MGRGSSGCGSGKGGGGGVAAGAMAGGRGGGAMAAAAEETLKERNDKLCRERFGAGAEVTYIQTYKHTYIQTYIRMIYTYIHVLGRCDKTALLVLRAGASCLWLERERVSIRSCSSRVLCIEYVFPCMPSSL